MPDTYLMKSYVLLLNITHKNDITVMINFYKRLQSVQREVVQ